MRIGIIGDPHEPCTRPGYRQFCYDTFNYYKCDVIVNIGDMIDWHGISFHARQPEGPGVGAEYEMAYRKVQKWRADFGKLYWCIGNHDERPARLAAANNIPEFMLRPYNELWGVPEWKTDFKFVFDGVLYKHGTSCSGVHPAWNQMNKSKMSVVMGHCHSRAGTKWSMNPLHRYFAMDVGCGINEKEYAFAYGKDMTERPILACGVVLDGQPISIAMKCGPGEKYHDSRFVSPRAKRPVFISKYAGKKRSKPNPIHYRVEGVNPMNVVDGGSYIACAPTELYPALFTTTNVDKVTCGNCIRTKIFKEAEWDE